MGARGVWLGGASVVAAGVWLGLWTGCQNTCGKLGDCGSSEFCSMADSVCTSALPLGFCKARPDTCPSVLSPVCGCDGKTYENGCLAARAGVSTAGTAACAATCGGASKITCGSGQYCEYGAVGTCLGANATGTCQPVPDSCPAVSSPVCGCDGETYANACAAALARTSVAVSGACVGAAPANGGTGGADGG